MDEGQASAQVAPLSGSLRQLPPVTVVSLRVAQFFARHKSFVADFNVPNAGTPVGVNLALDFQSRKRKLTLTSAPRHLSGPVNGSTSLLEIQLTAMEQSRD